MTNISIPQSFEDLKTYQSEYQNNLNISVIETNKLQYVSVKQQIFKNSVNYESDWIKMGIYSDFFASYPKQDYGAPTYTLGTKTVFVQYEITLNNVTEDIISTIQLNIFSWCSPDGETQGQTRPISNFDNVTKPYLSQILQINPDGTINLLIVAGLYMQVNIQPPYIPNDSNYDNQFTYPDGYGPLPDYYSKLLLTTANTRIYT